MVNSIPINVKVGMRLANDVAVDDMLDYGGSGDISGVDYLGPLRDKTGSCSTYAEVKLPLSVSATPTEINEEFTPISDPYKRSVYIRDDGSGSFQVFEYIKNSASVLDAHNLEYACLYYPNGITGTVTSGSPGTASEAARYDPLDDEDTVGFGDGNPGYMIVFESTVTVGGSTKYHQWFYDNVRISWTPEMSPNTGAKGTLNFTDARRVREVRAADSSVIA